MSIMQINRILTATKLFFFTLIAGSLVLAENPNGHSGQGRHPLNMPASGPSAREIFEQHRPHICLVTYYKNIAANSKIGSFRKIKQYRIGLLVNERGLIMVNSDVYPLSLDIISGGGSSFFSGEPSDFKVTLHDGREYKAEFIGKDDQAQVAFIQISEKLPAPLPFLEFAPTDSVTIGQKIYLLELLGESYDFQPIFTPLTINAIIPTPRKKFLVNNYIPALSAGGVVLSENGKAIGVTLKQSMDFHFRTPDEFEEFRKDYLEIAPSEWFRELIENPPVLVKAAYRGKPWLGIRMQALTPELKEFWQIDQPGGVVVDAVYENSPAQEAGLQVGDVIVALDGEPLDIKKDEELNRFREKIISREVDSRAKLTVFRKGKIMDVAVVLRAAPRAIDLAEKVQLPEYGLEVRELTRDILYDKNLPLDTRGVYVFRVDPASPAGLAGLQIGQIITHIDGKPVQNLKEFREMMQRAAGSGKSKIMLQVQSLKETRFVFLEVPGQSSK